MGYPEPEVDFWLDVQRELQTCMGSRPTRRVGGLMGIANDLPATTHSTWFITPSRARSRPPSLAIAFAWTHLNRSLAEARLSGHLCPRCPPRPVERTCEVQLGAKPRIQPLRLREVPVTDSPRSPGWVGERTRTVRCDDLREHRPLQEAGGALQGVKKHSTLRLSTSSPHAGRFQVGPADGGVWTSRAASKISRFMAVSWNCDVPRSDCIQCVIRPDSRSRFSDFFRNRFRIAPHPWPARSSASSHALA